MMAILRRLFVLMAFHAAAMSAEGNAAEPQPLFALALAAPDADWVYFRFLPTREQIEAVHKAKKRAFIAGPTVAGNVPDNWRSAAEVDWCEPGEYSITASYVVYTPAILPVSQRQETSRQASAIRSHDAACHCASYSGRRRGE